MSVRRLRTEAKSQIDAAIQAGAQPRAPRSGLGLVLEAGPRFRTLFDKNGITPAGSYYFEKSGKVPPSKFDYNQDPIRKGRSQYIKLLDGNLKKISTWTLIN